MYSTVIAALGANPFVAIRRTDLLDAGLTPARICHAVRAGDLIRARRGTYLFPDARPDTRAAAAIGGMVTCTTALESWGIFVLHRGSLHVHVQPHATRLGPQANSVTVHWRPLVRSPEPASLRVELFDALVQSTICQPPRAAVATLDNALQLGFIDDHDLDEIFRCVPPRRRMLRGLVDRSAESGSESFVRLLLRSLGLNYESQVWIEGVGRVDFLVEGWLIIECDSREFHQGWTQQQEDRRRDLAAGARGFATLRPTAADIFGDLAGVGAAITGILARLSVSNATQFR